MRYMLVLCRLNMLSDMQGSEVLVCMYIHMYTYKRRNYLYLEYREGWTA